MSGFSNDELRQLEQRGVAPEEARRQIDLFERPPVYAALVRPCTAGDGIDRLDPDELPGLHALHGRAAADGRFVKFVPASGAASRMFRDLLHYQIGAGQGESWEAVRAASETSDEARALATFVRELRRFPFCEELRTVLAARGEDLDVLAERGRFQPVLDALLDPEGLGYAQLPKGLLKFHQYAEGNRTPFEEHLVEAADYARGGAGGCRLHFTVSPEHRSGFEGLFDRVGQGLQRRLQAEFRIGYSTQKPSTDTLAVDPDNRPLLDASGRLIFRPGGHGALIENLFELEADLVFIKNIDNVQPDRVKPVVSIWKRALAGYLVRLQQEAFASLSRLRGNREANGPLDEALERVGRSLHVGLNGRRELRSARARRQFLAERLNRPIRVCGVVPNTGEPGGGPFWVRGRDGTVTPQIVESAQVDPDDGEQQRIFRSSTHFNPVDLVCGVRDADGRPYDLNRFIDEDAVIITHKSAEGRDLKAQERPGLWNGAMAGWNTVFVEVPLQTFSPVKTVLDLLRPEHQPA